MPWYFAYGSNMHSGTLRGRRGVEYRRAVAAQAPGWRLVFNKPGLLRTGEAFANLVPDANAAAYGVAFEVSEPDLAHIDLTEGVLIGNYLRVEIPVLALLDPSPTSTAYTLTSSKSLSGALPSTRYMALVIEGAIEHGLPEEHIEFLRAVPARPESAVAAQLRPVMDAFMKRRK